MQQRPNTQDRITNQHVALLTPGVVVMAFLLVVISLHPASARDAREYRRHWVWSTAHEIPKVKMFTATFYILTGLHALHVFGGLVLQAVVTTKGLLGRYWSYHHPGVLYSAMYWHFLDGMWLVLFGVLWLGS